MMEVLSIDENNNIFYSILNYFLTRMIKIEIILLMFKIMG